MKHYTYLLLVATLILGSCTTKQKASTEEWPITPKSEEVEELLRIDSICEVCYTKYVDVLSDFAHTTDSVQWEPYMADAIHNTLGEEGLIRRDSAVRCWHSLIHLYNKAQDMKAFEQYAENIELINLFLAEPEARLDFIVQFVKPLALSYYTDSAEGYNFVIERLHDELARCFMAVHLVGEPPAITQSLLNIIGRTYIEGEMWEDAEYHTRDILGFAQFYDEEFVHWGFDDTYRAEVHEARKEYAEAIEDIESSISKLKKVQATSQHPEAIASGIELCEAWIIELQNKMQN